jgi:hypothetical protein
MEMAWCTLRLEVDEGSIKSPLKLILSAESEKFFKKKTSKIVIISIIGVMLRCDTDSSSGSPRRSWR